LARAEGAPSRPAAPSRWLAGVATAAAIVLGAWNLELRTTTPNPVAVDALVHSHFTHHPLTGTEGSAKLIHSLDGSWVYLVADGLRPLASYELSVNGSPIGATRADVWGRATGFWARPPEKLTQAVLVGAAGASLRWDGEKSRLR
jgi:hypothetical protein